MGSVLLAGSSFGFIIFVIIAIGVVGLVVWSQIHAKKVRENWMNFARTNNLQVQGSTARPLIQGWRGQVYVTLNTVVRGSGKNRTTYTQYHTSTNAPMPHGLSLHKEGFFSKVGKVLGGEDVQVGDRAIDDAFIIKAGDLLGTHNLLSLPPVKKALMFCIARHPGLRVTERNILVEHTGMTGDLKKIEGVFEDLAYLALTFDAAYQQLTGTSPTPEKVPAPSPSPAKLSASKSAAAEILSTSSILGEEEFAVQVATSSSNIRVAAEDENPATRGPMPQTDDDMQFDSGRLKQVDEVRGEALSSMASAINQYADKLEKGEATPEPAKAPALNDAFASQDSSDAFADPHLDDDSFQRPAASALSDYDPSSAFSAATSEPAGASAFDDPDGGDAFADPTPLDEQFSTPKTEPAPEAQPVAAAQPGADTPDSLKTLIAKLSDSNLMTSDREELIKANANMSWEFEAKVDRIEDTWGFDTPDSLRDGKTVQGDGEGGIKFAVRFPKARNEETGRLRSGESLKAMGKVVAWDDLFKKVTIDAD